jgi:hypothetical protein
VCDTWSGSGHVSARQNGTSLRTERQRALFSPFPHVMWLCTKLVPDFRFPSHTVYVSQSVSQSAFLPISTLSHVCNGNLGLSNDSKSLILFSSPYPWTSSISLVQRKYDKRQTRPRKVQIRSRHKIIESFTFRRAYQRHGALSPNK